MFKFDLNVKHRAYFFLTRTVVVYRKKLFLEKNSFFAAGYVKIMELHIVPT